MLREITEREAFLLYQFQNAEARKKHLIAESLSVPLTEQETREAIEFYLSSENGRPDQIEREVLEAGFARHNEACSEMMGYFVRGQDMAEAAEE